VTTFASGCILKRVQTVLPWGQLDLRRFETILESAHQDGEEKTDRILESSDAADDQGEKVVEDTKKNKEKEESHATKQGISLV
jgi:hypothetical protein